MCVYIYILIFLFHLRVPKIGHSFLIEIDINLIFLYVPRSKDFIFVVHEPTFIFIDHSRLLDNSLASSLIFNLSVNHDNSDSRNRIFRFIHEEEKGLEVKFEFGLA